MKKFIIGFILGSLLTAPIVYAATKRIILQSSDGMAISSSNPLPVYVY